LTKSLAPEPHDRLIERREKRGRLVGTSLARPWLRYAASPSDCASPMPRRSIIVFG